MQLFSCYITVIQKTRTVIACRITVRVLLEYKEIRRSMNASCGRRLTEATFICVRGLFVDRSRLRRCVFAFRAYFVTRAGLSDSFTVAKQKR